mgnify:CR=1 FL=1|tara:strand:- start:1817 stop:2746 length:930 start_codon:yes stop_codon:yes gene_type:complete
MIWSMFNKQGKFENSLLCNIYACCKRNSGIPILARGSSPDRPNTIIERIERSVEEPMTNDSTLVTYAGDWGIEETDNGTVIKDPHRKTPYFNIDIQQIASNVRRWFTTNLKKDIHEKIYPVPINAFIGNWRNIKINPLRDIKKDKLCYANFTITSNYRITLAEWAWRQNFIDCKFFMQTEGQDESLRMTILEKGSSRLSMDDFTKTLASYNFCLCPVGNGLDTYKTWECIICNTVPIVQRSWMNLVFSKIWPMILVDRYELDNIEDKMKKFQDDHGSIEYDHSLLLEGNFNKLLDRIQHESDRLRRERV